MCGFIAAINTTVNVEKLLDDIAYRGLPGFKGYQRIDDKIQLGHYSLPFVNLDPEVAIQPRPGTNSLFVGEIFNYAELGFENDIEASYKTFWTKGVRGFHSFDGFWTYVTVVDGALYGVTDHLGIKPLYYRTDVDAMASEPDVLMAFGPVTRNELFHSNTMKWGYDPTGGTPWNEIKQVPPGSYVHKGIVHKYWDWKLVPYSTSLHHDLLTATELRLGGQREVAVLLSGGLDSTIIYGLLKLLNKKVTAIHVDNGEKEFADVVLQPDDIMHTVNLDDVTDLEAIDIHQSPVDLGSVKPQIAMARKLRELGFYAVMTGDGADELFGGYRRAAEYDSQYSDVFCELPYYHLPKLDRTMMRSTIELRAPFLAPSVIMHALNTSYDYRNGEKKILKKVFADVCPSKILLRDKKPLKTDAIRLTPMDQRIINETNWRKIYG